MTGSPDARLGPLVDLAGARAFVTGGTRGIGRATALLFARAGAHVAAGYRTREADAAETLAEIRALAPAGARAASAAHAVAIAADLGTPDAARRAVDAAAQALGGLDVLVVNHGVWPPDPVALGAMTDAQWETTRAANLDSVIYVCRAAIARLAEGGSIVLVSSTAGQRGEAFHADYAATKGAVIALTKSLAVELAPRIRVNCVAPGWVDTEMAAPAYEARGGAARAEIEAGIPLRRVASADDVAGPIVFLASPLARHITGEILNVNGGSVLCG